MLIKQLYRVLCYSIYYILGWSKKAIGYYHVFKVCILWIMNTSLTGSKFVHRFVLCLLNIRSVGILHRNKWSRPNGKRDVHRDMLRYAVVFKVYFVFRMFGYCWVCLGIQRYVWSWGWVCNSKIFVVVVCVLCLAAFLTFLFCIYSCNSWRIPCFK